MHGLRHCLMYVIYFIYQFIEFRKSMQLVRLFYFLTAMTSKSFNAIATLNRQITIYICQKYPKNKQNKISIFDFRLSYKLIQISSFFIQKAPSAEKCFKLELSLSYQMTIELLIRNSISTSDLYKGIEKNNKKV